ncbi:hypothetical protein EJB05_05586, partial [Eragrostis curvula]
LAAQVLQPPSESRKAPNPEERISRRPRPALLRSVRRDPEATGDAAGRVKEQTLAPDPNPLPWSSPAFTSICSCSCLCSDLVWCGVVWGLVPQGDGTEAQVTWEDQQNINRFGRLNNRLHELDEEIKLAKEANENLDDAGNELILSDEDVVRFQIGEVFAHMPREDVETKLEQMKEDAAKKLERLEEEKESIVAQMAELKKILYGKFKDAINLEED